ncbi:MAG: polysaccharide biosynthesis C-terminal domain-containing protein [Ferruginibacter sp.]
MSASNSANLDMTASNRQNDFGKRSSLLIASHFLKLLVQLLILYSYARLLSVEEYGRYQLIWLFSNLLSVIGLFGLPALLLSYSLSSIQQWIQTNQRLFFITALLLQMTPITGLILTSEHFNITEWWLLVAMILIQHGSILAETIAVKQQLEKRLLLVNILYQILFLFAHMIIFYKGYSLKYLLLALIGSLIVKIVGLWNPFFVIFTKSTADLYDRKIGEQWLYLGLNDVLGVLFKWVDKWFILYLVSVAQFALYFNGSYEIPVYFLMLSAVGSVMLVEMSRNKSKAHHVLTFHRSAMFLSSFVFPSFAYLLFYHAELFTLLFSEKYEAAIPIFFVTLWVLPLRITNFTAVLQVHQRTDIILKGAFYDLMVALILMFILYPLAGLPGLALAFVLSTWMQTLYYSWHTSLLLQIPLKRILPFTFLITWWLIAMAAMGISKYLLLNSNIGVKIIIGALLCGVLLLLMLKQYRNKSNEKDGAHQLDEEDNE